MAPTPSVANQKASLGYLNLEPENSSIGVSLEYAQGEVNLGVTKSQVSSSQRMQGEAEASCGECL